MRRALITTGSAALGAAGVMLLAPHGLSPANASATTGSSGLDDGSGSSVTGSTGSDSSSDGQGSGSGADSSSGSAGSSGSSGSSSGSGSGSGSSSSSGTRTVDGSVVSDRWGPVQVEITVEQGKVSDITMLQLPSDGRSRFINDQAVPILVSQALQAQSANIDGVSGATDTTRAFIESLTSALQKAGL